MVNECGIAGLTVGDPVLRTGNPLSVELGPGKITIQSLIIYLFLSTNYIIITMDFRNSKDYIRRYPETFRDNCI